MNGFGSPLDLTAWMARQMRCPQCLRRFRAQDVSAIEQGSHHLVCQFHCPICSQERLLVITWDQSVLRAHYTELDAEEWLYYRKQPPLGPDDVIRIHQMLKEYDGDLSDVLEDPFLGTGNE